MTKNNGQDSVVNVPKPPSNKSNTSNVSHYKSIASVENDSYDELPKLDKSQQSDEGKRIQETLERLHRRQTATIKDRNQQTQTVITAAPLIADEKNWNYKRIAIIAAIMLLLITITTIIITGSPDNSAREIVVTNLTNRSVLEVFNNISLGRTDQTFKIAYSPDSVQTRSEFNTDIIELLGLPETGGMNQNLIGDITIISEATNKFLIIFETRDPANARLSFRTEAKARAP